MTFTETTRLSSNVELLRRSLDPSAQLRVAQSVAASGRPLAAQPIDPIKERFLLYQPGSRPEHGYALLVFIPPSDDALIPPGWTRVLDRYGIIFVTAARSGNDANVIGRREPLALVAEQNVVRRYRIDPSRIWVAGFSGGSRVAMRLALAYPDVFTGAILNAGSDPIGARGIPMPPQDLAARFRAVTRIVYVTGEWDSFHLAADAASSQSMKDHCVRNVHSIVMPWTGHALMDGTALTQAVKILDTPASSSADHDHQNAESPD